MILLLLYLDAYFLLCMHVILRFTVYFLQLKSLSVDCSLNQKHRETR